MRGRSDGDSEGHTGGRARRPRIRRGPSGQARSRAAGRWLLLLVLAFLMLFPFVYVIAVSFSSYKDIVGQGLIIFPTHPTTEAYRAIFKGGIVTHALWVSIGLTLGGTAVNMLMTVTMAYGLSRPGMPGSRFVLALVLFTLLFAAGIIPNYLLVKNLGLINSYGSLILPGVINAFNLVILRQFFMSLPAELLESARLDGANDLVGAAADHPAAQQAGAGGGGALLRRRALERFLRRHALPERRAQVADPAGAAAVRVAGERPGERGEHRPEPAGAARRRRSRWPSSSSRRCRS